MGANVVVDALGKGLRQLWSYLRTSSQHRPCLFMKVAGQNLTSRFLLLRADDEQQPWDAAARAGRGQANGRQQPWDAATRTAAKQSWDAATRTPRRWEGQHEHFVGDDGHG